MFCPFGLTLKGAPKERRPSTNPNTTLTCKLNQGPVNQNCLLRTSIAYFSELNDNRLPTVFNHPFILAFAFLMFLVLQKHSTVYYTCMYTCGTKFITRNKFSLNFWHHFVSLCRCKWPVWKRQQSIIANPPVWPTLPTHLKIDHSLLRVILGLAWATKSIVTTIVSLLCPKFYTSGRKRFLKIKCGIKVDLQIQVDITLHNN